MSYLIRPCLGVALVVCVAAGFVNAQPSPVAGDFRWVGGTGEWGDVSMWEEYDGTAFQPATASPYWTGVFLTTGGTVSYADTVLIRDLWMGAGATFQQSSGILAVTLEEKLGEGGAATMVQTGGVHLVGTGLTVGSGAAAQYTLGGGSLEVTASGDAGGLAIGGGGAGTFILNAGTLKVLAPTPPGPAPAFYERIGGSGGGTFTQNGGTHIVTTSLGVGVGGTGVYGLHAGELRVNGALTVGEDSVGLLAQESGTSRAAELLIGGQSGSLGTYELTNGSLTVDAETVGVRGVGRMTQTAGNHYVNLGLIVGHVAGSKGTITLSGGTLTASMPTNILVGVERGRSFKVRTRCMRSSEAPNCVWEWKRGRKARMS